MLLVQSTSSLKSIGQLICVVLLFLFVLALAYAAARIAGSFQSNVTNKNSNFQVIEVFRLSNSKIIEIIKIGNRYLALAICKDNVTVLTELNESEIKEKESSLKPIDFSSVLDKIKNEIQEKSKKN